MERRRLVALVALGAAAAALAVMSQYPEPVWEPVRAEVTQISTTIGQDQRYQTVFLRTPTAIGQARIAEGIARCEVGDIVDAEQAGVALRGTATTCR